MRDLKDLTVEDIKATLLVTGEEIIGPIEQEIDEVSTFTKPAKFIPLDQDKMMVISIFMFGDFERCDIKHAHIISTVQARKEIAEAWLEKFAGKKSIIQPKEGIIIPS